MSWSKLPVFVYLFTYFTRSFGMAKFTRGQYLFTYIYIYIYIYILKKTNSDRLGVIRWSVCFSKYLGRFSTQLMTGGFSHRQKSPHSPKTLTSILVDFTRAVIDMASFILLISYFLGHFFRALGTFTRSPNMGCISITFTFQSFFFYLARSRNSSFFF